MGLSLALVAGTAIGLAAGSLISTPALATGPQAEPISAPGSPERVDRLIVTTSFPTVPDATVESVTNRAAADVGLEIASETSAAISRTMTVVELGTTLTLAEATTLADEMEQSPAVIRATPDYRVRPAVTTPNDPSLGSLWGLWNTDTAQGGFSVRGPVAWPTTTGNGAVVAVLDTGITAHPDLDAQVLAGYDFISSVATANDGDGRDADPTDPGDWITSAEADPWGAFPYCGGGNSGREPLASSWHGTHVSGTIAAIRGNSLGIVGVAPGARILPVRVLGKCGGTASDIIAAIEWASGGSVSGVPANSTPADVINMSLGGVSPCFPELEEAIRNAVDRGSTVVVAAGNSNTYPAFPGDCADVISVAASARTGAKAYYSSFGSVVDVTAPGGDYRVDTEILSTVNSGTQGPVGPGYRAYQGTSMAAPHVAGVAALLMGALPSLTPAQVEARIKVSTQPFGSSTFCGGGCGTGYVDAGAAVATLFPRAPASVSVLPDPTSVLVGWSPPQDDGGSAVLHYEIAHTSDDSTWITDDTVTGTSATITGLVTGTPYKVRVRAVNALGTGAWITSSSPVAPRAPAVPSAPRTPGTTAGNGSVAVAWSPPADDGGRPVTGYAVETSTDDSTWTSRGTVAGTSTTIAALTNGQTYVVRVAAVNAIGQGPWVTTAGTPVAPPPPPPPPAPPADSGGGGAPLPPAPAIARPGPPEIGTALAGDGTIAMTWNTPDDTGGAPVDAYIVELISVDGTDSVDDSAQVSITAMAYVFTDLVNGTSYRVRVSAVNRAGQGAWSDWSPKVVPLGPAGAPRNLMTTAGDSSATLAWTPPDQTGGSPVQGYRVEVRQGTSVQDLAVTATSTSLVGLRNGTTYSLRVAAATAYGTGAWSDAVWVRPRATPVTAPTQVRASISKGTVRVTWSRPATGDPLRYVVSASINGRPAKRVDVTNATLSIFRVPPRSASVTVSVSAVDRYGRGPASKPVQPRPG
jgi:serine protease